MNNAGKIADAEAKLASGFYENDPDRAEVVRKNITKWQAEDDGIPIEEQDDSKPQLGGRTETQAEATARAARSAALLPSPSRAAAALLEESGFTVADMVTSEAGATGDKVTVNEVRAFLAAQDG